MLALLVVVSRAPVLLQSVASVDEGLYALVAREWLRGHLPYTSVWETKPPFFFALLAGAFALFGETLLGKNNSFNRPPFGIAFASINYPINKDISVQASGTNIFNAYSGLFPVYGGGVTVPLVNGLQAGTIGNVLGPARYSFQLIKTFGQSGPPIQSASRATSTSH